MRLRIDVVDSGPGIAPKLQLRVFQPFTQGNSSDTRRNGGMGLGLSMVPRLVTLMGGQVALASTPGQDSTFSVRLALGTVSHDN